jgi:hypothetical protein
MNKKIKAIEEYLKYFPYDNTAIGNLNICYYADELDIELSNKYSYYPRFADNMIYINEQIIACKRYRLTSSATNYKQNSEDTLVVWKGVPYAYTVVNSSERGFNRMFLDVDEWRELIDILKSYNPLDYDEWNNVYIYDVENGKKLIKDYDKIIKSISEKSYRNREFTNIELENKKMEFEKLIKELEENN